ncbi:MAG TPA: type II toxin-antitoxin system VapC family toxin [Candidatus Limnocylindrales bacterium]|nr:type II toxin-antitoxin system VapC family toxin [Candidatus Limnocylindrales bacterium]
MVLDSSAALALLLDELESGSVRAALGRAAGSRLFVLDLFWLEVVNVLVRRHGWDADAVVEALRDLDELGIETIAQDRPLLLASLDLASSLGISAYDAAHLALAEATDATLLALDGRLVRAAGRRAALRPAPGTHEEKAAYGSEALDWARHGRYLAELRRAAASA